VTGLLFDEFTPARLDWLIQRAVAWYAKPEVWRRMMIHAMARDFSWERVVDQYSQVYDRAVQVRAEAMASSSGSS
jgi:starch synthase